MRVGDPSPMGRRHAPFVVGLHHQRVEQADAGVVVGEDADDV